MPENMPAEIRKIRLGDLMTVLKKGFDDFRAKPSHIVFLGLFYPIIGLIMSRLAFGYDILPLLFPLIAGFTLVGPFAAIGFYELSRRREQGLEVSWAKALGVLSSTSLGAIAALALVLTALFIAWLWTALQIYDRIFAGVMPGSMDDFLSQIFNTPEGQTLIVVGCGVGFLYALLVFSISVVSFPMLLDRKDVGALEAVQTSIRAVLGNPFPMMIWGLMIALGLAVGSLPFFIGLAVIVPVLGHASWHLYRMVVVA